MVERHRHLPQFPLTADMSAVLGAARQQRAEATSRFFIRIGAWIRGVDVNGPADALRQFFRRPASRLDNGTVR